MTAEHTKEPWMIAGDGADVFAGGTAPSYADAVHVADFQPGNPGLLGMRIADPENAKRAVACVNACEGINPEAVPEMLAACKGAEQYLPSHEQVLDYASSNEGQASSVGVAAERVRAAIAKAKPTEDKK